MSWTQIINNFFEKKKKEAEEKYLKDEVFKKIKDKNFFGNDDIKDLLSPRNQISSRSKFENLEKYKSTFIGIMFDAVKDDYQNKLEGINKKFNSIKCIDEYSQSAGQVSFATHVVKLSHSKIDVQSHFDCIASKKNSYLSTSSLQRKKIDGAVSGNQYAPIYQFLELELEGKKMAVALSENQDVLNDFAQNDDGTIDTEKLTKWNDGFQKALDAGNLKSHFLLKQIYFSINTDEYHILCNVKSSSLAQAMHEKMNDFDSVSRKQKEKCKYSNEVYSQHLQKAVLKITASNHSNASQLNGARGGRLNLLNTQPPNWNKQIHYPKNKSFFDEYDIQKNTKVDIDYLRDFLIRFEKIDLSIKNPDRFKWVKTWVGNIVDSILVYSANLQKQLEPGWSKKDDVKLKVAHQYFLDPYRQDELFQAARFAHDWQDEISKDFSFWLNRRLIGKDKKFTPQKEHQRLWIKLMESPLRDHVEILKARTETQVG